MSGLRGILVAVDYNDLLVMTLPYNRHHFSEMMVVTGDRIKDNKTVDIAYANGCTVYRTGAFWDRGAHFNKWVSLELGLDAFERRGWMCIMDADVLWPSRLEISTPPDTLVFGRPSEDTCFTLRRGQLCTPRRRMYPTIPALLPDEEEWVKYPHHHVNEFAGYTQIFHAADPVLGPPPWHEINWKHAGGADSFFQKKWLDRNKVRPPFSVLHLGPNGTNWCGRASPYADGTVPEKAQERIKELKHMMMLRRHTPYGIRFNHEKL